MTHRPDDVAIIKDVTGTCQSCGHHTTARLVGYYSGHVIIRCNECMVADKFTPDNGSYTDAHTFAPFITDEDDQRIDENMVVPDPTCTCGHAFEEHKKGRCRHPGCTCQWYKEGLP